MKPITVNTTFTQLFNHYVQFLGVTNQKLAEIMGVHHTTIARWRKEVATGNKVNQPEIAKPIILFAEHFRLTAQERDELLTAANLLDSSMMMLSKHTSIQNFSSNINQATVANPFITGQPVKGEHFIGRHDVLRRLFSLWQNYPENPIQSAVIYGERTIGKTSLLLQLKYLAEYYKENWLPQYTAYRFIYLNFKDRRFTSQQRVLHYLLQHMPIDPSAWSKEILLNSDDPFYYFTDIVSEHLSNKPTIILMDDVDFAIKNYPAQLDITFWNGLNALASTALDPQCLGFVMACSQGVNQADKQNIELEELLNLFGYQIELQGFSNYETLELIRRSPCLFKENDQEFILTQGEENPYQLQLLCRLCLEHYLQGEKSDDWQGQAQQLLHHQPLVSHEHICKAKS